MLRVTLLTVTALANFLQLGCTGSADNAESLQYETREVAQSFGDCDADSARCAVIRISYPHVTGAVTVAAAQAVNEEVDRFVRRFPMDTGLAENIAAVVDTFGKQFTDVTSNFPDYPAGWNLDRTVSIETDTLGIIALKLAELSYTGGAHPMYTVEYENFNAATGSQLGLTDIINPDAMEILRQTGERRLRSERGLPDSVTLDQAGFWFGDSTFVLPENFLIEDTGLLFYYNPYEIAPYAMGPITITIPYRELAPEVKPDSPIHPFIAAASD